MIFFSRNKTKWLNFLLKFKNFKGSSGIFIAKNSFISVGTTIGVGTRINGKILIKGSGSVNIGKYCAIGSDVKIISSNHSTKPVNLQYTLQKKIGLKAEKKTEPVIVGHNVWIGDSVIILSGVNIGNGAVLAAGSVATKDVEPYAIVGGVPAKFIKSRFEMDKINQIENSQWWDWSIEEMKKNINFFKK